MAKRNWIIDYEVIDETHHIYGPYTEEAAKKAEARIRRHMARMERQAEREGSEWTEGGDWLVGTYPIHQWSRSDEKEDFT